VSFASPADAPIAYAEVSGSEEALEGVDEEYL